MNEKSLQWNWGVPDWRDSSAYPEPDDLTLTLWRWEFLRRRQDYREDWLMLAHLTYECTSILAQCGEDIEAISVGDPRFRAVGISPTKYGLLELPDPSQRNPGHLGFIDAIDSQGIASFLAGYHANELGLFPVYFRLSKPLREQIRQAETHLKQLQQEKVGSIKERHRNIRSWPYYLRVIDAHKAGATWREIGEEIYDKVNYDEAAKFAYNAWKRARSLMFNFPN